MPVFDTSLNVVEVGDADRYPILILHGGPGLDHHEFGDYLHPLADRGYRLLFVDLRSQGASPPSPPQTWTIPTMAEDVVMVARNLGLGPYAVLGHSFGAFVALQNAVDFPGMPAQTIVSGGVPSARWLAVVEKHLAAFEPAHLREQVAASWEREASITTPDEFYRVNHDQLPFHFADPLDPRIDEYERRSAGTRYAPDVLRRLAAQDYGDMDLEHRLGEIQHPVLVLAGRHDRACTVQAAQAMADGIPDAELVVFEESGHMTFVEETDAYLNAVDEFLKRKR
ncbi:MAG TPA: alpha/beta fold hydrolase [Actinomycetota bacterium]|nr:alpha/beta fold hydrolase [Actinomycetota bacterium]